MLICRGDNSSKANITFIKYETIIIIFVFNHLGYWCNCLYYIKLIVITEKLNDNKICNNKNITILRVTAFYQGRAKNNLHRCTFQFVLFFHEKACDPAHGCTQTPLGILTILLHPSQQQNIALLQTDKNEGFSIIISVFCSQPINCINYASLLSYCTNYRKYK